MNLVWMFSSLFTRKYRELLYRYARFLCVRQFLPLAFLALLGSCQQQPSDSAHVLLGKGGLFQTVLDLMERHKVSDIPLDKVVSGAMNGALHTIDEFSEYYPQKDYEKLSHFLEGEFGGIGVEIKMTREGLEVIAPLEHGPAHKAGLKPGDLITAVDHHLLTNLSPLEVLEKIHGTEGSSLTLTFYRKGVGVQNCTLSREMIQYHPAKGILEGRIAYLRLPLFHQHSATSLSKEIVTLKKQLKEKLGHHANFQGAILDVRNNPGGTLEQAVAVTNLFLDKGEIVHIAGNDSSLQKTFYAKGPDQLQGCPIVILINKGSASASEVLAGALRDHKRAILVGESTYGKGSVQRIFNLKEKGAVKLTVAYFTTPLSRIKIQGQGLQPDILVENSEERTDLEKPQDHMHSLTRTPLNRMTGTRDTFESLSKPHQLDLQKQRALDLIQGISALNLHPVLLQDEASPPKDPQKTKIPYHEKAD